MARAPIYFKKLQFHYIDLFIVLMVICSVYFTTAVDHCILPETVDHCILLGAVVVDKAVVLPETVDHYACPF